MRTGAEYKEALRDGRKLWIMGEGEVADVTAHPATANQVNEYAAWYDRHHDPEWADVLLTPPGASGRRQPLAFTIPRSVDDIRRLGRAISTMSFKSAGNITHTPGYGALIALGIIDGTKTIEQPAERIAAAEAFHAWIAETGAFVTFSSGGPPFADRFRDAGEKKGARLVRETDRGVIVDGMVAMHTASPFADEVYVNGGVWSGEQKDRVWFSVALNNPGVRIVARKVSVHHPNAFMAPLSSRFDELDAVLWLDNVEVPYERVFAQQFDPLAGSADPRRREGIVAWLWWHQQLGWLAHAEFTLGLALALTDAMGLRNLPPVVEQLMDLVVDVQTIRSCVTAAELDTETSEAGYIQPGLKHLASASIYNLKVRQRMSEILRNLPGSSICVAPADSDLLDPGLGAQMDLAFTGGGYSAMQRAALLQLAWDHVSSSLDGRESAFELHANGGIPVWRSRLQRWFTDYTPLANAVSEALSVDMPRIDLDALRDMGRARTNATPAPASGRSA